MDKKNFIVRFFEKGVWYDINQKPVSKEEAENIYFNMTYGKNIYTKQNENIFFQIKEISI